MALINSQSLKEGKRMSENLATEDIVEVNELGQHVVIAAKGQPIPEGYTATASKKKVAAAPEDKSSTTRRGK